MKTTIVIYGSSTGSCQSIAETIASKLGVEAVDVANIDDATITSHENLLLGTSTWGAGEMQDDWYDCCFHLSILLLVTFFFGCKDTSFFHHLQYLKMMVSQKYLNMGIDKKF